MLRETGLTDMAQVNSSGGQHMEKIEYGSTSCKYTAGVKGTCANVQPPHCSGHMADDGLAAMTGIQMASEPIICHKMPHGRAAH